MFARVAALQGLLLLAYPALMYFALGFVSPRVLGLCTLALIAARMAIFARTRLVALARLFAPVGLAFAATSLLSLIWNDELWLRLAPALVNLALFAVFALSLARRETAIETIARAQVGELSAEEVTYCRRVTVVWSAFLAANSAACAAVALLGSREAWALYTGVVAYVLLGVVFASEYVYRHWRFRRYVGAPTDVLLRRLFPPRPS